MSELKSLLKNRIKCCAMSGANGESILWKSALNRIEELEVLLFKASEQIYDQPELEQEIQDSLN